LIPFFIFAFFLPSLPSIFLSFRLTDALVHGQLDEPVRRWSLYDPLLPPFLRNRHVCWQVEEPEGGREKGRTGGREGGREGGGREGEREGGREGRR